MLRAAVAAVRDRSRPPEPAARQLVYIVLVGTLPVGIAGLAFKHAIEGSLRSLWVISGALIVVALAMAWVERAARHTRDFDDIRLRDALIIGCAQALALVPGVSRSGITLVAALALGLRRDAAARFSFLLGVPAIAAAGIFEFQAAAEGAGRQRRRAGDRPDRRRDLGLRQHRLAAALPARAQHAAVRRLPHRAGPAAARAAVHPPPGAVERSKESWPRDIKCRGRLPWLDVRLSSLSCSRSVSSAPAPAVRAPTTGPAA